MKKRILAVAMSIMTTMMVITGCGSKESNETSTKEPEAIKLDTWVTVEDLLSTDNMSALADMKDIKDFKGIIGLDLVFDIAATMEGETSNMKADVDMTIEHDGKVLHAIADVKSDMMGETTEEKNEMWCSAEDKIKYSIDGDTWHKTADVTPEELLEELVGIIGTSSEDVTIDDATIDEMVKDFKLELDEKNGVLNDPPKIVHRSTIGDDILVYDEEQVEEARKLMGQELEKFKQPEEASDKNTDAVEE